MLSWEPSPGGLTLIHNWGRVIQRCHMKPGLRGKHSQVIHTWAHVTLTTHMMPNERIAPLPRLGAFNYFLIFDDCLHLLWLKYLGFPH